MIAVLAALASSNAGAEPRWSGYAHIGTLAVSEDHEAGTTLDLNPGGWAGLLHRAGSTVSAGAELGYYWLPTFDNYAIPAVVGYPGPYRSEFRVMSASGVVRLRWPAGPELLGSFGYYDHARRDVFIGPDHVEHEGHPGFSIAAGAAGSGPVGLGLRFRWHHVLGPPADHSYPFHADLVSCEIGLHFR